MREVKKPKRKKSGDRTGVTPIPLLGYGPQLGFSPFLSSDNPFVLQQPLFPLSAYDRIDAIHKLAAWIGRLP